MLTHPAIEAVVLVMSAFGPVSRFADRFPLVRAVVQKLVDLDALLEAVQSCVVEDATPKTTH